MTVKLVLNIFVATQLLGAYTYTGAIYLALGYDQCVAFSDFQCYKLSNYMACWICIPVRPWILYWVLHFLNYSFHPGYTVLIYPFSACGLIVFFAQ